jgi:hypothetical protein
MESELTIILQSGTKRPMGRPPLSKKFETKAVLVRLTEDVCDRIDAFAGPNKRGEFIREAVEREIKRRERAKD